jgi:hypothetical protein
MRSDASARSADDLCDAVSDHVTHDFVWQRQSDGEANRSLGDLEAR